MFEWIAPGGFKADIPAHRCENSALLTLEDWTLQRAKDGRQRLSQPDDQIG